ncbi:hypothetical protein MJO28_013608 [Puccinia striiformis f. sp. tritici]|uniref:Uncharacterized protein n=1 Tax=Puccinia striiformis f. sp. tritici TaxID=168172 RepID=A0ACC0DV40_9BASI|nr:hypothetical protein MJO28_013608 [Puccinia striiformis f. sp. tritici]
MLAFGSPRSPQKKDDNSPLKTRNLAGIESIFAMMAYLASSYLLSKTVVVDDQSEGGGIVRWG